MRGRANLDESQFVGTGYLCQSSSPLTDRFGSCLVLVRLLQLKHLMQCFHFKQISATDNIWQPKLPFVTYRYYHWMLDSLPGATIKKSCSDPSNRGSVSSFCVLQENVAEKATGRCLSYFLIFLVVRSNSSQSWPPYPPFQITGNSYRMKDCKLERNQRSKKKTDNLR